MTSTPVKQAVISASAPSLLYPGTPVANYSRERFEADLIDKAEADIRQYQAQAPTPYKSISLKHDWH